MTTDDEATPSSSEAAYFESPNEARKKALIQKLKQQGKKQAAEKQGANLQDLKLALLKSQVTDKPDTAKQQDDADQKSGSGLSTKTREQEVKADQMEADSKPNTDETVKQSNAQKKVEEEVMSTEIQSDQS